MTAKLLIREVGQREFVQHNGDFEASPEVPEMHNEDGTIAIDYEPSRTDVENAYALGTKLCAEGNVEAFQVWKLKQAMQRAYKLEPIT